MDFLTLFPYLGILFLVIVNAVLVLRRDIEIETDPSDHIQEQ